MATITLSEIRDRVRFLGTFENSTKFTTARLNVEINSAWSERSRPRRTNSTSTCRPTSGC
jgi:hypothetical protein